MNFFGIGGVGLMQIVTGQVVQANTIAEAPQAAYTALFGFYAIAVGAAITIYLLSRDAKPGSVVNRTAS